MTSKPEQRFSPATSSVRSFFRDVALRNALDKRAAGVPTYSVPEAAALLSISQEYLYRLIQADGFPAVQMRIGSRSGRYIVPANAVEQLLKQANESGQCVDAEAFTSSWRTSRIGGAA